MAEIETAAPAKPKEKLLSKKNRRIFKDPLSDNNPITLQILGICSALAVTVQVNLKRIRVFPLIQYLI